MLASDISGLERFQADQYPDAQPWKLPPTFELFVDQAAPIRKQYASHLSAHWENLDLQPDLTLQGPI